MSGRARCDEILRLIDQALADAPPGNFTASAEARGHSTMTRRDDDN